MAKRCGVGQVYAITINMNNSNDQKPTPEQQGVMENLLDALDKTSDQLSKVELRDELEARGFNTKAFLERTGKIISDSKIEHKYPDIIRCKHCGGYAEAKVFKPNFSDETLFYLRCANKECVSLSSEVMPTRKEAILKWNEMNEVLK